ncbi:gata zinc finger domain-containing protein [Anaeramoeba flamelloides]|uniref:Gata zinc finger domain-containing protein n=1 Tax=Anaeramoeba flamelloides TaxID=1746091 RepID=A0AAV7ZX18_9EUKA|nr:gata zinc finger domain-containing protein [Anaeramoeba flamelloides]
MKITANDNGNNNNNNNHNNTNNNEEEDDEKKSKSKSHPNEIKTTLWAINNGFKKYGISQKGYYSLSLLDLSKVKDLQVLKLLINSKKYMKM